MISAYSRSPEGEVVIEGSVFEGNTFLALGDAAFDAARCLVLVNAERAKVGLSPLAFDSRLNKCSADYAAVLATPGVPFSHTGPDGSSPFDRIKRAGFPLDGWSAENIAGGFPTADAVMTAWMNSPGHKANILQPHFTVVGIWQVNGYWVQDFGQLSQPPPPAAVTLISHTLSPVTVPSGQSIVGTLALNGPAPAGGVSITLVCSCGPFFAAIPATVVLPQGASSATYTIVTTVQPAGTRTDAIVTAALGGVHLAISANFSITSGGPPPVSTVRIDNMGGTSMDVSLSPSDYAAAFPLVSRVRLTVQAVSQDAASLLGSGFNKPGLKLSFAGLPVVFKEIGPDGTTASVKLLAPLAVPILGAFTIADGSAVVTGPQVLLLPGKGSPPPPASTPFISAITPMVAAVGNRVRIDGQHFGAQPGAILLGGAPVNMSNGLWTDTQIRFDVPPFAVTGSIVVHNAAGDSNAVTLTIQGTPPPAGGPVLKELVPSSGRVGNRVDGSGTGFDRSCFLIFSSADGKGVRATLVYAVNDGAIATQVPPGAVSGPVYVSRHSDNTVSGSLPFIVSPAAPGEGSQGDGA